MSKYLSSPMIASEKVTNASTNIYTWLGIAALVIMVGMQIGTSQTVLSQLERSQDENDSNFKGLRTDLAVLKDEQSKQGYVVTQTQKDITRVDAVLSANVADDSKQWEAIRENALKLSATMTREAFMEWKSQLERRNQGITTPMIPPNTN